MKTSCCTLSLLVVLLGASTAPASPAQSFEGVGEARVVGGNVVSARRQALGRARSAALVAAIASVSGPEALPEPVHRALLAQSSLIRTYRVLEEAREGGVFRLKVVIQVDMVALRRQLLRRGVKARAPVTAAKRVLGLWAPPQLRLALERGLRARGYQILALRGTVEQAQAQARGKAAMAVFAWVRAKPTAGVRGLGLLGATLQLGAKVHATSPWRDLGSIGDIYGHGAGRTVAAAREQARAKAAPRLLRALIALLDKNSAGPALKPGAALVGIAGLQGLAEMKAICELLRSKLAQSCALRRLEGGRVWLHLAGIPGVAQVVRLLTAYDFGGFVLALERTQQQRLWLRIRRGDPAPAALAP